MLLLATTGGVPKAGLCPVRHVPKGRAPWIIKFSEHLQPCSNKMARFSAVAIALGTCFSLQYCTGFGPCRVNFFHSGWCGAVFCICTEHRVDYTEMLLLLLDSVYTQPRPFLLFYCHTGEETGGAREVVRRHSQDR